MAIVLDATVSRAVTYSGANGNVVVSATPTTVTGFTLTGGAGATTFRVFDNATTNSGQVLFASTLAAGVSKTFMLPMPLKAQNGVTINASAAGAAGAVYRYGGGPRTFFVKSISGAIAANVVGSATPVVLYGVTVNPAAAGTHTLTVFDNASTSTGTIVFTETSTTAANDSPLIFNFATPVKVSNGLTATIATTAVGDITFWVG
jgi:hypothetical protein